MIGLFAAVGRCLFGSVLALTVLSGCAWQQATTRPGSVGGNGIADEIAATVPQDAQTRRALMVGCWIGTARAPAGQQAQWLTERFANGTYRLTYRVRTPQGVGESEEIGQWGVVGPVFFTQTRGVLRPDGSVAVAEADDGYFDDAYLIDTLNKTTIAYRHLQSQEAFRQDRATADCVFPSEPV